MRNAVQNAIVTTAFAAFVVEGMYFCRNPEVAGRTQFGYRSTKVVLALRMCSDVSRGLTLIFPFTKGVLPAAIRI